MAAKAPLNRTLTASESVSNLSETDSAKKARRGLRLGDRVLVNSPISYKALYILYIYFL